MSDKIWANSGDSHYMEPPDLYTQLPEHLRKMLPEVVARDPTATTVFLAEALKPKATGKHSSTREMTATGVWSGSDATSGGDVSSFGDGAGPADGSSAGEGGGGGDAGGPNDGGLSPDVFSGGGACMKRLYVRVTRNDGKSRSIRRRS